MEWLTSLFDVGLGATGIGGVVTGAIGGAVGVVTKYYQEKQRQEFEVKRWANEKELLMINIEADSQKEKALSLFNSLKEDANLSKNASPWANSIKVIYRPFLTTLLIFLSAYMFSSIMSGLTEGNALSTVFTNSELKELIRYMVISVFFTTTTAASWWFCERALTPSFAK
ncbi:hypothetical protein KO527_05385 [Pseudoalteromonas sp. C2R02]|uniref:hypothetical protein n=1 Tax=Pseudoalteromonas sp. C2R02 TaxID=2841565 RepID=UPI001C0875B3|nr:hypothetical protein [Pseudoalteromonas sp. C2R02]MBU2968781.1 hypothetical protein [Pseudoalteromonas sp. C2R02]